MYLQFAGQEQKYDAYRPVSQDSVLTVPFVALLIIPRVKWGNSRSVSSI